jgi:acetyl-CoA acetyltransferase
VNPSSTSKTAITVEDVLRSRMIAYPFRLLQCCLAAEGSEFAAFGSRALREDDHKIAFFASHIATRVGGR